MAAHEKGDVLEPRAARLRQREPIAALGFSTWPTRAEAEQAAVPWDACVEAFDFGLPQVCTPTQRQLLLRDDSPVVIFEDKMMYRVKGPVPIDDYTIPFGVAEVKRASRLVSGSSPSGSIGAPSTPRPAGNLTTPAF